MREVFTTTAQGCLLRLRVHPGARQNAFTGVQANALKLSLSAPPVDGKANDAMIAFVAAAFGLPRSRCSLVAGKASRSKTVLLESLATETALERLAAILE